MKSNTKFTIGFVAIVLLTIMVISMFVTLGNMQTTKKLILTDYAIGSISAEGNVLDGKDNKSSIYTKNLITVEGMNIDVEENASISYSVFYYDADKQFVSADTDLIAEFSGTIPATAKYFRVLVVPQAEGGKSIEINVFNMATYTRNITISYNK